MTASEFKQQVGHALTTALAAADSTLRPGECLAPRVVAAILAAVLEEAHQCDRAYTAMHAGTAWTDEAIAPEPERVQAAALAALRGEPRRAA